ncbi:hypothetical protein HC251_23190 [Iamia sp. SCSIO 61187]|uniref:hypothetical protein n=1 Tax=Iamia sp. SCSIO 61187 TaxID=2722752 RepID=UPI001C626163|nr:hypothetical protein [Iamia sp. SCSIO 61187]QYG95046.1 hypothetical protein HC251_23190 [Iamia sp. SCSIO 61187]
MDTSTDLDQLASDLATHGVAANEHALARLAREGRAAGASSVAVAVLGDRREPWPARIRAFTLVARHLTRPPQATSTFTAA